MSPEKLLQHFEQISEAPAAVARLRRFVLGLAVRGKLVPQIQAEESAGTLLRRIQHAKARDLEGNRRQAAPQHSVQCLFDIPSSWKWVRLGDIGIIVGGGTPPSKDDSCFAEPGMGIPWLTPADMGRQSGLTVSRGARDLTEKGLAESSARLLPAGAVVFTSRAPIGYTAIAANSLCTNQGFKSIIPHIIDLKLYLTIYLRAFTPWINENASGTTFKEVSGKIVSNFPVPLPPLEEQRRIAIRLDELMSLYDELEAAQTKRERRRDRLVVATLHGLNNGEARAETGERPSFEETARFYFNHLPRLTTRPEHVQQLRQTILSLAVSGKLVPHDPNDEPAGELLRSLEEDVTSAVRKKRMRTPKPIAGHEGELPKLPNGWKWSQLGRLTAPEDNAMCDGPFGSKLKTEHYIQTPGYAVIRLGNIGVGQFISGKEGYISLDHYQSLASNHVAAEDLIVAGLADPIVRCCEVPPELGPAVNKADCFRVRLHPRIDRSYVRHFLNSPIAKAFAAEENHGMTRERINLSNAKSLPVPIPPLAEQRRIVAKVNKLMAICKELERSVNIATSTRRAFLEATLQEALGLAASAVVAS